MFRAYSFHQNDTSAEILHNSNRSMKKIGQFSKTFSIATVLSISFLQLIGQETLLPISDGNPPQTLAELWSGFDPQAESLEEEMEPCGITSNLPASVRKPGEIRAIPKWDLITFQIPAKSRGVRGSIFTAPLRTVC
ncbi:MAG TPA: hypothetical protein DHV39_10970 [Verrucomicrobiales bacterium]|nr:hypothetical protein [Verrucomicrobiales bacterium]HCZ03922.1 hypothetical protein [Verrucomicrobiales bacterium]